MSWLMRLRNAFRSDQITDEIDREMAFHIAERTESLQSEGIGPEEARREAQRRFGNQPLQRERTRDRDLLISLDTMGRRALRPSQPIPRNNIKP